MLDVARAHGDPVFDAQPVPTLLLDRDLTIRAVSKAYAAAVHRSADELLGMPMFEAFPDNPDDPHADGVANLGSSLEAAARQKRAHHMLVQRYDICAVDTGWMQRLWSPVNTPILTDDGVGGLMHQVRDITPVDADVRKVLHGYRDLLRTSPAADAQMHLLADYADAVATALADNQTLAREVMHLRRALTSRATIEQAKGIVMADRRCSPDEAFDVLRKLSSDTNVRLAEVALALVYKAQERPAGPRG